MRKGAVGNNDRVASARRRIATPRTRLRLPGVPDPNPKRQLREFKTATSALSRERRSYGATAPATSARSHPPPWRGTCAATGLGPLYGKIEF